MICATYCQCRIVKRKTSDSRHSLLGLITASVLLGHRGIDGTGASVGRRPELRPWRRRWNGLASLLFTPHTVGLLGQTRKRFGLGRPLALGLGWHGWDGHAWLGPSEVQHDEQPYENKQSELVEKPV